MTCELKLKLTLTEFNLRVYKMIVGCQVPTDSTLYGFSFELLCSQTTVPVNGRVTLYYPSKDCIRPLCTSEHGKIHTKL